MSKDFSASIGSVGSVGSVISRIEDSADAEAIKPAEEPQKAAGEKGAAPKEEKAEKPLAPVPRKKKDSSPGRVYAWKDGIEKKNVSIYILPEVHEDLKAIAALKRTKVNDVIETFLNDGLKKYAELIEAQKELISKVK